MQEFDVIKQYFTKPALGADLGVGDDAALIRVCEGHQLAISADMSVVGTHFFADAQPSHIGWKSLAVNVSDIAAMGALPKWATLSIALPEINPTWLAEFARGFFACAEAFKVELIGGDTTRGPLNISIQIMGEVPIGQALKRDGAQVGDDVWVSGHLGAAAMGLAHLQNKITLREGALEPCLNALQQPQPRVALGLALRGLAHSCIDISDGLLADLGHILHASQVGAILEVNQMPCLMELAAYKLEVVMQGAMLAGGDDYELCFTAPVSARAQIEALAHDLGVRLTRIGVTTQDTVLIVLDGDKALELNQLGYNHFATS
jgi:thiamine-monophosphate kinase